jgi:hypothetical protein
MVSFIFARIQELNLEKSVLDKGHGFLLMLATLLIITFFKGMLLLKIPSALISDVYVAAMLILIMGGKLISTKMR